MKYCKLALLLLCLALAITLAACQTPDTPDTDTDASTEQSTDAPTSPEADPDALGSYTVYLSADATVWERKCAEALISKLEAATGTTLSLNRDEGARTDCEIIICGGPAKAGFDADKIGYNGYAVKREGNKLTLSAAIENGMLAAVDYTIANVIKDGKVAKACDVLTEQDTALVTPDPNKHINVTISGDTGYDIYKLHG